MDRLLVHYQCIRFAFYKLVPITDVFTQIQCLLHLLSRCLSYFQTVTTLSFLTWCFILRLAHQAVMVGKGLCDKHIGELLHQDSLAVQTRQVVHREPLQVVGSEAIK